jgi:predicted transcriptional regulator
MWYDRDVDKTTIYLPDDLHRGLRDAARRAGRGQADLIREALVAYLSKLEAPVPGSIGAGEDDGLTARDSEAWLRDAWARRDHA